MPAELLTVRQAADRIGATDETIRRWIRYGRLHAVMPGGRSLGYRILAADVERLLGADAVPECASPANSVNGRTRRAS